MLSPTDDAPVGPNMLVFGRLSDRILAGKVSWDDRTVADNNSFPTDDDGDGGDGDKHVKKVLKEGNINPKHYTTTTRESVRSLVRDMVKARKNVLEAMRVSGNHNNDEMNFCTNPALMKVGKNKRVDPFVAYYFILHCKEQPDMDAAFTTFMSESFKASSNSTMIDSDDEGNGGSGSKGTKKMKELGGILSNVLHPVMESMSASNEEAKNQRASLLEMQQDHLKRKANDSKWNDYTAATDKLADYQTKLALAEGTQQERLYKNLIGTISKRIRQLERDLNIPEEESVISNE